MLMKMMAEGMSGKMAANLAKNAAGGFGAWKAVGMLLTLAGAAGIGFCICQDRRLREEQLRTFERAFSLIAGEISYSRISLPQVLQETGEKMCGPAAFGLGEALVWVAVGLSDGSGQELGTVWRREMGAFLKKTKLDGEEKTLILSFPEAVCFLDGQRQQAAVLEFAAQLKQASEAVRQRRKEEDKITMAFCLACSAMAAILLV